MNGQDIPYTIYRHNSAKSDLTKLEISLLASLDNFVQLTGDYAHPAMTVLIGQEIRAMEYDGGLTTDQQQFTHEVFHSWWARGVHPATYADGWIDEAWDEYNTSAVSLFEQFDWDAPPVQLFDPHPCARKTSGASYNAGPRLFAGFAYLFGVDELRSGMAQLYESIGPLGSVTTAQLERFLYCHGGKLPEVRQAFWRFVYGQSDQASAAPSDYCD